MRRDRRSARCRSRRARRGSAARLSPVCMPVSTSVQPSPPRTRYTLTMVGRIGSGRNTCTTPSATSRVFAASPMLLVQLLLDREADAHPDPPGRDAAVLDHGGDAVDLDLGLDALRWSRRRAVTARPTASSMELVDVPVSSIVFSTMTWVLPPRRSRPGTPGGGKARRRIARGGARRVGAWNARRRRAKPLSWTECYPVSTGWRSGSGLGSAWWWASSRPG